MSGLVDNPWPYLAFASLHLIGGQWIAAMIYRVRFGGSPLVLYDRKASGTEHGRRTRLVGLATVVWAAAFIASAFSPGFRASVIGMPLFELSPVIELVGWIVGGIGLIGMMAAQAGMGPAFRVGLAADETPALVTKGLHRWSRNPVYVFSIACLLGISLWAPCVAVLVALAAIALGIHGLVLAEERFLAGVVGEAFEDYRRRVRRYV
jgi:protein-S-isoprenylcysteine O-methyltransferase Ste14